jgi:uncharacterized protein (UPF0335 family)
VSGEPTPGQGHNAKGQIRAFVERINRLEEEKAALSSDINDLKAEAKGTGLNPVMLTRLAKLVRKDKGKVQAEMSEFDLYLAAYDFLN